MTLVSMGLRLELAQTLQEALGPCGWMCSPRGAGWLPSQPLLAPVISWVCMFCCWICFHACIPWYATSQARAGSLERSLSRGRVAVSAGTGPWRGYFNPSHVFTLNTRALGVLPFCKNFLFQPLMYGPGSSV